jgi:flavin reductase (DIM6/NTAB) family NADH-FMN oxidoreductase RutF
MTVHTADALAWIDCRITGRHDAGDHSILFGEVVEAHVQRAGEPYVHLRKNGLSY